MPCHFFVGPCHGFAVWCKKLSPAPMVPTGSMDQKHGQSQRCLQPNRTPGPSTQALSIYLLVLFGGGIEDSPSSRRPFALESQELPRRLEECPKYLFKYLSRKEWRERERKERGSVSRSSFQGPCVNPEHPCSTLSGVPLPNHPSFLVMQSIARKTNT